MTWNPHARLLTIYEAADSIDRPASTIRRWISEGRLTPHAHTGRRALYLEADILAVEAATRRRMVLDTKPNTTEHSPDMLCM